MFALQVESDTSTPSCLNHPDAAPRTQPIFRHKFIPIFRKAFGCEHPHVRRSRNDFVTGTLKHLEVRNPDHSRPLSAKVVAEHEIALVIHKDQITRGHLSANELHCVIHLTSALILSGHVRLMMKSEGIANREYQQGERNGRAWTPATYYVKKEADSRNREYREENAMTGPAIGIPTGNSEDAIEGKWKNQKQRDLPRRRTISFPSTSNKEHNSCNKKQSRNVAHDKLAENELEHRETSTEDKRQQVILSTMEVRTPQPFADRLLGQRAVFESRELDSVKKQE